MLHKNILKCLFCISDFFSKNRLRHKISTSRQFLLWWRCYKVLMLHMKYKGYKIQTVKCPAQVLFGLSAGSQEPTLFQTLLPWLQYWAFWEAGPELKSVSEGNAWTSQWPECGRFNCSCGNLIGLAPDNLHFELCTAIHFVHEILYLPLKTEMVFPSLLTVNLFSIQYWKCVINTVTVGKPYFF